MTGSENDAPKRSRKGKARKTKRKPGRPAKKTSAAEIARRQRVADIMALRLQGWSLEAIGDAQTPPVSSQRIHAIITKHLADTATLATEELRQIELARLDEMQIKLFENAVKGDLLSIDRTLAIMARRHAIVGLNAAAKVQVTGKDGGPIESRVEIEDAAAEVKRKLADAIAKTASRSVPGEPDGDGSRGAEI